MIMHTKGPWKLSKRLGIYLIVAPNEHIICDVGSTLNETSFADALIIVQAPELLELCEMAVEYIPEDSNTAWLISKIRNTTAQARGRSEL